MKLKKLFFLISFFGLSSITQKTYSEGPVADNLVVEQLEKSEKIVVLSEKEKLNLELARKIMEGKTLTSAELESLKQELNVTDIFYKFLANEELTNEEQQLIKKYGKYAIGAGAGAICFYLVPPFGAKALGQVVVKGAAGVLGGYGSINFAKKLSHENDLSIRGLQAKFKEYFKQEESTDSEKKS